MIEFYVDTIGVGLIVAGTLIAVRVWGWAVRPDWLRSDWCTNPLPLRFMVRVRRAVRAYRSI
jgi:hypothetical protein